MCICMFMYTSTCTIVNIGFKNYKNKIFKLIKSLSYSDNMNIEPDQIRQFLSKDELTLFHAQGIILGCRGAGKTTLLKRLMDAPIDQLENGLCNENVDVHIDTFTVMEHTIQGNM